jgi:hypothetical protein
MSLEKNLEQKHRGQQHPTGRKNPNGLGKNQKCGRKATWGWIWVKTQVMPMKWRHLIRKK